MFGTLPLCEADVLSVDVNPDGKGTKAPPNKAVSEADR